MASPLAHDSAAEIAQPQMKSWMRGEVEAVPGKAKRETYYRAGVKFGVSLDFAAALLS